MARACKTARTHARHVGFGRCTEGRFTADNRRAYERGVDVDGAVVGAGLAETTAA